MRVGDSMVDATSASWLKSRASSFNEVICSALLPAGTPHALLLSTTYTSPLVPSPPFSLNQSILQNTIFSKWHPQSHLMLLTARRMEISSEVTRMTAMLSPRTRSIPHLTEPQCLTPMRLSVSARMDLFSYRTST